MRLTVFLGTCLLAALCLSGEMSAAGDRKLLVTVVNPLGISRSNETIALPISKAFPDVQAGHALQIAVFDGVSHIRLVTQTYGDEILFQSDFLPWEKKSFVIEGTAGDTAIERSFVDGRFVPPRDDYAWENDRIAFRMYGPALAAEVNNGIDVWTKRVRSLIVAKWYKAAESSPAGHDPYHQDTGEGADFFDVGRSLGAGGSGLFVNGKVMQPGVFSSYVTLCNGPLRVSFELTYDHWSVGKEKYRERKRITLDAGSNLNRIDVTFEKEHGSDTLMLACGLVKRKNTTRNTSGTGGWLSLWGLTNKDTVNGFLGTGIVIPGRGSPTFAEDSVQYLGLIPVVTGKTFTYYAGAGWTRSGDFSTAESWNKYLEEWSERLKVPLRIDIQR